MSSSKDAQKKVSQGERPKIPKKTLASTNAFDQVLVKAIQMCWIHDPNERASSRKIQTFLDLELKRLGIESDSS
jgi:hypothetical protein